MAASDSDVNTSRFWEFYALRYSVGTVIGALVIFFLVRKNQSLADLIFVKPGEPIDIIQLGIFLGLGLVFSYLSSAPILVFHIGRFLIPKKAQRSGKGAFLFLFLNCIPPVIFFFLSRIPIVPTLILCLIVYLASAALSSQLYIVHKCSTKRSDLYNFYIKLSSKRAKSTGGIVDSYRHMREHGNAFAIVLCEMILAMIMFGTTIYFSILGAARPPQIFELTSYLSIVLLIWITPAVFAWLIACYIEQEFVSS